MSNTEEKPIRIALLEDDGLLIESFAELIDNDKDVSIVRAWIDINEAYRELFNEHWIDRIDVFIIDLMLPIPSTLIFNLDPRANSISTGYYFYRAVSEKFKPKLLPAIFLTGALNANQTFRDNVESYVGSNTKLALLEKPQTIDIIIATIKKVYNPE